MPHRTLLASLAAGALLAGLAVGLPTVASATPETGPGTVACAEAGKVVTAKTKNRDEVQAQVDVLKAQLVELENAKPKDLQAIQDKKDEIVEVEKRLGNKQTLLDKAVADQTTACTAPAEPKPKPKPEPEPKPDPVEDKDCKDFADQAAAQAFFVANGPGDPHNLDLDKDGQACELDERENPDPAPGNDGDDQQVDEYPVGGVATGGGPAL